MSEYLLILIEHLIYMFVKLMVNNELICVFGIG